METKSVISVESDRVFYEKRTPKQVTLVDQILKSVLISPVNLNPSLNIRDSSNIVIRNEIYVQGDVSINNGEEFDDEECLDLNIVSRRQWGAIEPKPGVELLKEPVNLVIIGATATESDKTFDGNQELLQYIQNFHMNSRNWSDISYNFVIGGDGRVYEGRGWTQQGAHSFGFNNNSIGIWFIGTFITTLPSKKSLKQCEKLISYGVRMNYINPDYKLIGQCQCRPFESPGWALFEEIKTWKNWVETI